MKSRFNLSLLMTFVFLLLISCKKEDNSFYEYSTPSFVIYQKPGEPEAIYAYCSSHDVYMDSIYVTSPLNIKSRQYFQGAMFAREIYFLVGDTFVPHAGKWTFIFYGRKVVNGLGFSVFMEQDF